MDGTPTLRLNEFMLSALAANKVDHGSSSPRTSIAKPQEITFKLDSKDKESIKLAEKHFDELIGAHELTVRSFHTS